MRKVVFYHKGVEVKFKKYKSLFESLIPELKELIFTYLQSKDIVICFTVSKDIYKRTADEKLWKFMLNRDFHKDAYNHNNHNNHNNVIKYYNQCLIHSTYFNNIFEIKSIKQLLFLRETVEDWDIEINSLNYNDLFKVIRWLEKPIIITIKEMMFYKNGKIKDPGHLKSEKEEFVTSYI